MFLKSYETLLQRQCASCSISISDDSPKDSKLRLLTTDSFEELSNIEVLSYIYGITVLEMTTNLIQTFENAFSEDGIDVVSILEDSNSINQICNNTCLVLCQSCAPKLSELYSSYKNFANTLAFNCLISKATKNITIGQNLYKGCSQQTEKQNNSLPPCNVEETESHILKIEEFDYHDSDGYNCEDNYIFPVSPEQCDYETNVKQELEPLDELRIECLNNHTNEVPKGSSHSSEILKIHKDVVNKNLKCRQCDKHFESNYELQKHGLKSHFPQLSIEKYPISESTKTRCLLCNSVFEDLLQINSHVEVMHKSTMWARETIANNDELNECKINTDDDESQNTTDISPTTDCGENLSEISERHLAETVSSKTVCQAKYNFNGQQYSTHPKVIKGPPYECPLCSHSCKKLESLKIHCRRCHNLLLPVQRIRKSKKVSHDLPISCGICLKAFPNEELLQNHNNSKKCGLEIPSKESFDNSESPEIKNISEEDQEHSSDKSNEILQNDQQLQIVGKKSEANKSIPTQLSCLECAISIKNIAGLRSHYKRLHNLLFVCTTCHKAFPEQQILELHNCEDYLGKKNSDASCEFKRMILCPFCDKSFDETSSEYTAHVSESHKSELEKIANYKCPTCLQQCSSDEVLQAHNKCHSYGYPLNRCELCDKNCMNAKALIIHKNNCHRLELLLPIIRSACSICNWSFKKTYDLRMHMKNVHSTIRCHECTICHMKFKTEKYLKRHIRTHTAEKLYKCSICNFSFLEKQPWKNHMEGHNAECIFPCEVCGKVFQRRYNLRLHSKIHTMTTKSFFCEECGSGFKLYSHLQKHKRLQHKNPVTQNTESYICSICGLVMKHSISLTRHMKWKHSNDPSKTKILCVFCGKELRDKYKLKDHLKNKHPNEEYPE